VRGARHRRDVLLLSRFVQPSAVESRFAEGWSSSVVAAALSWADEGVAALGADWTGWLATRSADPADDALLAAYGGSFRDIARAELRTTSGWIAKAQYAAALVWPSRANLAARGVTRRQHLRRLVSSR
jgi:hypothetical protein